MQKCARASARALTTGADDDKRETHERRSTQQAAAIRDCDLAARSQPLHSPPLPLSTLAAAATVVIALTNQASARRRVNRNLAFAALMAAHAAVRSRSREGRQLKGAQTPAARM